MGFYSSKLLWILLLLLINMFLLFVYSAVVQILPGALPAESWLTKLQRRLSVPNDKGEMGEINKYK
jgi:hypothetical protein